MKKQLKDIIEPEVSKIKTKFILMVMIVLLGLTVSAWQIISYQLMPVDGNDQNVVEIRIPEKSSAHEVAVLLAENKLIRSDKIFLLYCRKSGLDKQLKPGLYNFSRSQSLPELAQQVAQGRVKGYTITIPEGYTVRQIGELLVSMQLCTQSQWQDALQVNYHYDFINPVIAGQTADEKRFEGYLFPDTYAIEDGTDVKDIIKMMLNNFAGVWKQEFAAKADAKQMTLHDIVVIASLVEREARLADERKTIAGVIYNRMQKGMPLQIDATVLYSLGEQKNIVTYKDLETKSPYNTYKNIGLPPGPIACPGRAAIAAALDPEKHNYYYYVAKGDNSHYFSTTYNEHLEAIQRYGQK